MIRRKIEHAERFAVWKAWSGNCYWCREPILFKNCHIDHVLPLDAASKVGDTKALFGMYALPEDFDLDSFGNWVPACPSCNQRKSDLLIDSSPQFTLHLMQIRSKARLAQSIAEKIRADAGKANLLVKVATAVTAGDISKEDLEQLFADLPGLITKSAAPQSESLLVTPGWQIHRYLSGRTLAIVSTPSGATGVMPISANPHSSWYCPTCGNPGPWDGVICRSCGYRSEPD